MSLVYLQCCGRKRKQAGPQATTEDLNPEQFQAINQDVSIDVGSFDPGPFSMQGPDMGGSDIDDTAVVPANGFLAGNSGLPTYRPKKEVFEPFSPANWVLLTISDVLSTMRNDSHLARCVLFETARLQRPLFSVGSVKLSQEARAVDMQLIELKKVLGQGDELVQGGWSDENHEKQKRILKGELFQKALRTAKKSLLDLEKTFNDQILGELKNGMQSKDSIDYEQIVGKVRNLNNELQQVYDKVTTLYYKEERAAGLK